MQTLHIVSSPRGERSKSKHLGDFLVSKLPGNISTLDLSQSEVPYINENIIAYNYGFMKYEDLNESDKKIADIQSTFIQQLKSVENIVISAPLWNFGMPAVLKGYIDLVVKVGETFSAENGGLLTNIKNLYIVTAKGGVYEGTAWQNIETLEANIKQAFAYMGVSNAKVFQLEGVNAKDQTALNTEIEDLKNRISQEI